MNKIYIIGAGGVGSWLLPAICLLDEPQNVVIMDGDMLESKNLNRQLFTPDDIGSNKAEALAAKYHCESIPKYFSPGLMGFHDSDWLLVAVDNNPARKAALEACDTSGCRCITGANEAFSAEAYYYEPEWRKSPEDPRVYYPEILTDTTDDPRRAAIGCTGEVQKSNRQLVSANFMAAALIQHLYVLWKMERPKFDKEAIGHLPHRINQNLSKYTTVTKGK